MADMKQRDIRNVQLNEKISDTQFDVLHPETTAQQVITNTNQQFVSQTEKDKWNAGVEGFDSVGMKFQGPWVDSKQYFKNDVVSYNNKYYIAKIGSEAELNLGKFPTDTADNTYWELLNKEAIHTLQAESVKVRDGSNNAEHQITFVTNGTPKDEFENLYADSNLTYNPSTNKMTLKGMDVDGIHKDSVIKADVLEGKLNGSYVQGEVKDADVTEKYHTYKRDAVTKIPELDEKGNRIQLSETPYVEDALVNIQKDIDNIEVGGASTKGSLTITTEIINEDGSVTTKTLLDKYKGSKDTVVPIKQSYLPGDIVGFLDPDSKILEKWLPASVLGQLSYQGTFDPTVTNTFKPNDGDYFIAKKSADNKNKPGMYNPDGSVVTGEDNYYNTGDWAVYHKNSWAKIDNTDAVTMVNGQKGAVETYKGEWIMERDYYRGDIVKHGGVLYIANIKHRSATAFEEANWEVFGRLYGATDGIRLDTTDYKFKHDVAIEQGKTTDVELQAGQKFKVPVLTRDKFGHITKIDFKNIGLGSDFEDTTRPIAVGGTQVLAGTGVNRDKVLDLEGDSWINIEYANDKMNFKHAGNKDGAKTIEPGRVENPDASSLVLYPGQGYTVPKFSYDDAGHAYDAGYITFKLADALVKHRHFNIVKDKDGAQLIEAYKLVDNEETQTWIKDAANSLKFFTGNVNPFSTEVMKFNGAIDATNFFKKGVMVLDTSVTVMNGFKHDGVSPINSTYHKDTNTIETGDSGVVKGVYSAVEVNNKGIVTAGGQIVEFGTVVNADPSASLAVGGLFFRKLA